MSRSDPWAGWTWDRGPRPEPVDLDQVLEELGTVEEDPDRVAGPGQS